MDIVQQFLIDGKNKSVKVFYVSLKNIFRAPNSPLKNKAEERFYRKKSCGTQLASLLYEPVRKIMKNDFAYINALKGLVIFMMDNHELCANIAEVPAIIKPEELKKYFNLYTKDNQNIKQYGSSFPVINSGTFFRYGTGELTADSRMLLINCDNMIFALCAEKVLEIVTLNRKNGGNSLEFTPSEDGPFIKGIVRYEDNAWLLPDFTKISSELQAGLIPCMADFNGNAGKLKLQ